MSSVAVPHSPRRLGRARAALRRPPSLPPSELLFGAALAVALSAIGLRAGGGLAPGPTTYIEMVLDVAGGLLGALAAVAAVGRRWWSAVTIGLFAVLAIVTAWSIVWAVEPNDAWLEANRTVAYVAVFGGGVVLVRLGGAWWTALLGALVVSSLVICTWALLTKIFPGALSADEIYARLREPYGYWNAVGLTAAMGIPPTLWLGARRSGHAGLSALAYPIMGVLILAMMLAYSRGALLAVAVGCAVWFAVVPLRLRAVAVLSIGAAGALLVTAWVFAQDTLTEDKVSLDQRTTSGHELGIAVLAMILVLLAIGLALGFAAARRAPAPHVRRRAGGVILVAVALVPVALVVALALSDKGLGGSISSGWKSLTDPNSGTTVTNDPSRLTSVGSVRARYWDESYKIFRAHPWKGVGAGGYKTARDRYRTDQLTVVHAHGYVVQTGADLGILGLAASLLLLVAWLGATARTLGWRLPLPGAVGRLLPRRGPPETQIRLAGWGPERVAMATVATIVVVFGVHSFIDWTWYVPGTVVPALLCAGWVAGRDPLAVPGTRPMVELGPALRAGVRSPWRIGLAVLLVAAGLLAAWTAWQPLRSINAGNDALAKLGEGPRSYPQALDLARTARDRNPLSLDPLFEIAVIQATSGQRDAARNTLEDAVRLQPSNPASWLRLAEFELDTNPRRALRLLGPALYLDPKSPTGAQTYLAGMRRLQAGAPSQP